MTEMIYTSPEAQVEKLISQNMIINDKEHAIEQLRSCGYSNLIKSYREPYVISIDGRKSYRADITFEHVESLYTLDKNLRNAVMSAMQDLEEHIKEAAADTISSSFGIHQDDYLKFRNYRDRHKSEYRFTLGGIINKMKETLDTDKNPIHHYATVHNIVPPWILFKSIYFSTIVNFIHQFKPAEQAKMVARLYDVDTLNIAPEDYAQYMISSLFICLKYRNIAAHGGRIYNYDPNSPFIKQINPSLQGISVLMSVLDSLKYKAPAKILHSALLTEINRHCKQYPEDVTYLSYTLNLDISATTYVWASANSNKYHFDPHCSGLSNAMKLELNTATNSGLIPCKRCCK